MTIRKIKGCLIATAHHRDTKLDRDFVNLNQATIQSTFVRTLDGHDLIHDCERSNEIILRLKRYAAKFVDRNNDLFLLYYTGHGFTHEGKLYLCSRESDESDVSNTCLLFENLAREVSSCCDRCVIFLDCCSAGAAAADLSAFSSCQRVDILGATAAGKEVSASRGSMTPFTAHLCDILTNGINSESELIAIADVLSELKRRKVEVRYCAIGNTDSVFRNHHSKRGLLHKRLENLRPNDLEGYKLFARDCMRRIDMLHIELHYYKTRSLKLSTVHSDFLNMYVQQCQASSGYRSKGDKFWIKFYRWEGALRQLLPGFCSSTTPDWAANRVIKLGEGAVGKVVKNLIENLRGHRSERQSGSLLSLHGTDDIWDVDDERILQQIKDSGLRTVAAVPVFPRSESGQKLVFEEVKPPEEDKRYLLGILAFCSCIDLESSSLSDLSKRSRLEQAAAILGYMLCQEGLSQMSSLSSLLAPLDP